MARTTLDPQAAGACSQGVDGTLIDQLIEELGAAWRRGERPRAEDYLDRYHALGDDEALQLVYEEVCLRLGEGETDLSDEFSRRFPQWRSRLGVLIEGKRLLNASRRRDFPEVGDDLGDFALVAELGRGAVGRTFLASQKSLADRWMALKVIPLEQDEHLSLARLQHMNIVPLYFEQELPERNLRLLSMPYLGGASLARVLQSLNEVPVAQRTGADLLEALDHCAPEYPGQCPANGPVRTYLARASYVHAVCWIGASLADALHSAHERGLVHLDVKPSNVLIAGDGQPMLLDFHLARAPVTPDGPLPERLGGTPEFFSPEQQAAIGAIQNGHSVSSAVDGRSDIYSLGLLLYDALAGDRRSGRPQPLSRCNPSVSRGLSDLIGKCLAENPTDRYPDGASLALDLRRHLNDLPLRGVRNRSWLERWQKWRRRNAWVSSRGPLRIVATAGLVAAVGIATVSLRQHDRRIDAEDSLRRAAKAEVAAAREHYDLGRSFLRVGKYAEAEIELRRAIELRPDAFWPHYDHGLCCYRLGRFDEAAASLSTAIALAPRTAECYYNRALAHDALHRPDAALEDYTRALELAPAFSDAALNRGILLFRAGQLAEALDDFQRARSHASSPSKLGLIRFNEALVHLARTDDAAAEACLEDAIARGIDDARRLREQLRAH